MRRTLLVIAFVPAIALIALWGVTSGQVFLDFQRQAGQGLLAEKAGQPSNLVYYSLQEERRLSADVLAGRSGAANALKEQRVRTDEAVRQFQTLSDVSEDGAPQEVLDAVSAARAAIARLDAQRSLVDSGDDDQQQAVYDYYTDLIAVDLDLFAALSHVDNGRITTLSQPLVDLFRVKEMISRSDAILARGWADRTLSDREFAEFRQLVSAQSLTYTSSVVPYLPAEEKDMWDAVIGSQEWKAKTGIENTILAPGRASSTGSVPLTSDQKTWRASIDALDDRIEALLEHRTALVVEEGKGSIMSLLLRMGLTTVIGLLAIAAVITVTWRLTRALRRRIEHLRERAEELERSLPDLVERLSQGERIDVEAESQVIREDEKDRADDEITRLGEALTLARTSALEAAVRQSDQHRGFERLLQRIARRTQQLIGQQLKKLNDLEHRHEDPELLEDLFDLDHLTARLRRYEENLVILAGGSPHRRWRRPVALLDIMRSAQGEVQDYRRVMLDLDGAPWIAPRAVGPVTHVLAELIENALAFSRPPSPVEVRAAVVSRGLAIEVEDRGLGMDDEQLAELNELMARPPRMDLLARTEDIRLGLHVVSRLAAQYGLRVEFRSSAYGGTRAVVLVPHELVSGPAGAEAAPTRPTAVPNPAPNAAAPAGPVGPPVAVDPGTGALPSRGRGRALAEVTGQHPAPGFPYAVPDAAPPAPLPFPAPTAPAAPETSEPFPYAGGDGAAPTAPETADPFAYEPAGTAAPQDADPFAYTGGDGAAPTAPETADPFPYAPAEAAAPQDADPFPSSLPRGPVQGGPAIIEPFPRPAPAGAGEPFPYAAPAGPVRERPALPAPAAPFAPPVPAGTTHDGPADHGQGGGLPHPTAAEPEPYAPMPVPAQPQHPYGTPVTSPGALGGTQQPLPRRVRQASLADELRIAPEAPRTQPAPPPDWRSDPMLRPAPRRAGATIGAFQRRSREARVQTPGDAPAPTPNPSTREDWS
ncbi:nitrate- and nitrite sensing domain-containing protein [Streptomyces termitum]|uniref:histidine kinase n=1 Tax=Streptomyces termitum TaxID=67368 RepID=A0A918SRK0_9ACTN|nr:nitrate- and nitrite sensing domain-containing protein [Streptomyces termitum]GHA63994.1 histidine kinase [Streptomyces termitum]